MESRNQIRENTIKADTELLAACGLYCGGCFKYKKGSCPGCRENEKASWCKIRICTRQHNYVTCAECREFQDVDQCKKFNTIFSRIFAFIFRSDRKGCIERIKTRGIDRFVEEMAQRGLVTLKK